ncbi:hypothetical protein ElyMa_001771400 [Elysia marginata]|uniref:Uncharacterized protein n=1 Tax=Elysia marginata TaxID=1093978 RepID=A0AAV4EE06_9GAST|nr:hypothetical protein ElyMa_001771400 [Elysia marginata]
MIRETVLKTTPTLPPVNILDVDGFPGQPQSTDEVSKSRSVVTIRPWRKPANEVCAHLIAWTLQHLQADIAGHCTGQYGSRDQR